ncbi:MAG: cell division protein ZapE [Proteobacteria bacterium]|nr:cell division protein ZapE [Pseudomonadota bacterium]
MNNLYALYEAKLHSGIIRPDPDQRLAIQALEELQKSFIGAGASGIWQIICRVFSNKKKRRGYYFYGGVGRGKSMVMDLFFDTVEIKKKRRVHFHAFMLEVHDFLHAARAERKARGGIDSNLLSCAEQITKNTQLLCFDEFQVKDVADAMILGRLFTALFERGVSIVMTSNVAPNDLYADGLQRDRFMPFIELLNREMNVFMFPGHVDYRLTRLSEQRTYFVPHNALAETEMDKIFRMMADSRVGEPQDIAVKGRVIHVPRAARDVSEFSFMELCEQSKSALDYLELVKRFHVFLVKDVPQLDDQKRDAVSRFITLIDTLYDHRAQLVISASAPPGQLYRGQEHAQAFERTMSRLIEMQSREYRSLQNEYV